MLERGAYINQQNRSGETPAHACILKGCHEIMMLLYKKNADFRIANKHGDTLLHYAVRTRKYDLVQALLEQDMDPTESSGVAGSALELASKMEENFSIITLLEQGAQNIRKKRLLKWATGKKKNWAIDFNEITICRQTGGREHLEVYIAVNGEVQMLP